jgi:hypothetical protein
MTETRTPYTTNARPRIRYPGSRLELLVEALDDLAELAPEAYPLYAAGIHQELRAALQGETTPEELLRELMSSSQPK